MPNLAWYWYLFCFLIMPLICDRLKRYWTFETRSSDRTLLFCSFVTPLFDENAKCWRTNIITFISHTIESSVSPTPNEQHYWHPTIIIISWHTTSTVLATRNQLTPVKSHQSYSTNNDRRRLWHWRNLAQAPSGDNSEEGVDWGKFNVDCLKKRFRSRSVLCSEYEAITGPKIIFNFSLPSIAIALLATTQCRYLFNINERKRIVPTNHSWRYSTVLFNISLSDAHTMKLLNFQLIRTITS